MLDSVHLAHKHQAERLIRVYFTSIRDVYAQGLWVYSEFVSHFNNTLN